jgi:hypothetical protein
MGEEKLLGPYCKCIVKRLENKYLPTNSHKLGI